MRIHPEDLKEMILEAISQNPGMTEVSYSQWLGCPYGFEKMFKQLAEEGTIKEEIVSFKNGGFSRNWTIA